MGQQLKVYVSMLPTSPVPDATTAALLTRPQGADRAPRPAPVFQMLPATLPLRCLTSRTQREAGAASWAWLPLPTSTPGELSPGSPGPCCFPGLTQLPPPPPHTPSQPLKEDPHTCSKHGLQ